MENKTSSIGNNPSGEVTSPENLYAGASSQKSETKDPSLAESEAHESPQKNSTGAETSGGRQTSVSLFGSTHDSIIADVPDFAINETADSITPDTPEPTGTENREPKSTGIREPTGAELKFPEVAEKKPSTTPGETPTESQIAPLSTSPGKALTNVGTPKKSVTLDEKTSSRSPLAGGSEKKWSRQNVDQMPPAERKGSETPAKVEPALIAGIPCTAGLLQKRSPFIHNPPEPEVRRQRINNPRTPRDYIINLREDLADFQESHGLPRTRDYSFLSLGLALAQETGRAIYSLFLMLTELFPILAILSLILRFALDKLIEILETRETVPKIKKSVIFALEMLAIMIPLWILTATIIFPLITLVFSIFKRILRIKGGRKKAAAIKYKPKQRTKSVLCSFL